MTLDEFFDKLAKAEHEWVIRVCGDIRTVTLPEGEDNVVITCPVVAVAGAHGCDYDMYGRIIGLSEANRCLLVSAADFGGDDGTEDVHPVRERMLAACKLK